MVSHIHSLQAFSKQPQAPLSKNQLINKLHLKKIEKHCSTNIQSEILFRFLIGREKDVENSEIIRLIQQSLQMDQERSEMSRALQHHHENFHDQHVHDDGFSNLQLNDHDDLDASIDNTTKINHNELSDLQEKNYDVSRCRPKTRLINARTKIKSLTNFNF